FMRPSPAISGMADRAQRHRISRTLCAFTGRSTGSRTQPPAAWHKLSVRGADHDAAMGTFIPTERVLAGLINAGFVPVAARQTHTRRASPLHAWHVVRQASNGYEFCR